MTALMQQRRGPEFYVLDEDLRIVFSCPGGPGERQSLEPDLLKLTRDSLVKLSLDGTDNTGWQPYRDGIYVRHILMRGPGLAHVATFFERSRSKMSFANTAIRFGLSPRESEVFALLVRGLDTKGVARELCIAPTTARDHIMKIMQKTRSHRRTELLALAIGSRL